MDSELATVHDPIPPRDRYPNQTTTSEERKAYQLETSFRSSRCTLTS